MWHNFASLDVAYLQTLNALSKIFSGRIVLLGDDFLSTRAAVKQLEAKLENQLTVLLEAIAEAIKIGKYIDVKRVVTCVEDALHQVAKIAATVTKAIDEAPPGLDGVIGALFKLLRGVLGLVFGEPDAGEAVTEQFAVVQPLDTCFLP